MRGSHGTGHCLDAGGCHRRLTATLGRRLDSAVLISYSPCVNVARSWIHTGVDDHTGVDMANGVLPTDEEELDAPSESYVDALNEVKQRCDARNIEYLPGVWVDGTPYIRIQMHSGREKRNVFVGAEPFARRLLAIDFEDFVFISGFEAICSYSKGTIEASIWSAAPYDISRISEGEGGPSDSSGAITITPPLSSPTQPILRIGPASKELHVLTRGVIRRRHSITISGLAVTRNDAAEQFLVRYSNSLFFQIQTLYNSTLFLERERRRRIISRSAHNARDGLVLEYPKSEYDAPAISLYWYASSARGMPLLQFLAFYQTIEFYYPRFSQVEARKRLADILKDPTFRINRDDHVDRLISALNISRSGTIGDERSQLRSVVNHCLNPDDLRDFLQSDAQREAHVSGKIAKEKFHRIPLQNKSLDVRNDVADRIYDIRCSIVHTKNNDRGGDLELLLPFSAEADMISHDIDLVQFVAKSVLISTSSPL